MEKLIVLAAIALFFLVTPTPDITSYTPDQGLNNEVISMTIDGEKFDQSAAVKLSRPGEPDIYASEVKVESEEKITCKFDLKGKTSGKWDLIVANTDRLTKRQKKDSIFQGFNIEYPAPAIKSISPNQGINSGVIKIEALSGANFRAGIAVMLSNDRMEIGASQVELISDHKLKCQFNLSNAEIGTYNVKVVNADGKTGILPGAFVVQGPPPKKALRPEITAITPDRGFNNGYVLTTITGTNFEPEAAVKLVGPGPVELPGINIKYASPSQITCFFDIKDQPVGKYNVEVTNPSGQKGVLANAFTVELMDVSAIKLNSSLKPIFFDLDKDTLKSGDTDRLDSNLKTLSANPKLFILLGGHADERGSIKYNLDLSARRAENIKKYLVSKGIDPARITIYAYGKGHPAKQGHDESAWRYNRRVDIMVWEEPPTREQGLKGIKIE
ncbi:MAG: OmpA family protein [Bacillota bacterium]